MPHVPKNGTPSLTVNREIIQALMSYTSVSTYSTLSRSSTTISLLRGGVNWNNSGTNELYNCQYIFYIE